MKLDSAVSVGVTGGASGPGAATARMLASHGDRGDPEPAAPRRLTHARLDRPGRAHEYAHLARTPITCGCRNGEDARLDSAIRMAPR